MYVYPKTRAASGQKSLPIPASAALPSVELVAEWNDPDEDPNSPGVPMEVSLRVQQPSNSGAYAITAGTTPRGLGECVAGYLTTDSATSIELNSLNGYFTVSYGSSLRPVLVTDLRTQRLYLGPCKSVRVDAKRWFSSVAPTYSGSLNVAVDIAPAGGGLYDEPTVTYAQIYAAASTPSASFVLPQGARYFTPLLGSSSAMWGVGTTPNALFTGGATPVLYRPSVYGQVPVLPRYEIIDAAYGGSWAASAALAAETLYGMRFYLAS